MMNDDWDSVSNGIPPHSATDPWDAVSAPQPSRKRRSLPPDNLVIEQADTITTPPALPDTDAFVLSSVPEPSIADAAETTLLPDTFMREDSYQPASFPDDATPLTSSFEVPQLHRRAAATSPRPPDTDPSGLPLGRRRHLPAPLLRRRALPGVITILLVLSVLGLLFPFIHTALTNKANADATATMQAEATAIAADANATATAQVAATATTLQQVYAQATSGTPVFVDPLSDDSNGWGTFNASWGACGFNGGAYHFTLVSGGDWSFCNCPSTQNLNNFAFQVQVNIMQGDDGGIVFGSNPNSYYRIYIDAGGTYTLLQHTQNDDQTQMLQSGSSLALERGLDQGNVITVIVNNSNFSFYANNQFVTSAYLSDYSAGAVALSAESIYLATDVVFSTAKLWTF